MIGDKTYIEVMQPYLPDAHVEQLTRIEELLANLQYEDHYLPLQNEIYFDDGHEMGYVIYTDALRQYILRTGVKLSQDITVEKEVTLAEGLQAISSPDNVDVLSLLEEIDDVDNTYTLSVLLAEVTDYEIVDWYSVLEEVDNSLITVLKGLSTDEELVNESRSEVSDIKDTFKQLFSTVISNNKDDILASVKVLPLTRAKALSELDWSFENDDLAVELLMVLVLSGVIDNDELQREALSVIEDRVSSFTQASKLNMAVRKFFQSIKE